MQILAKRRRTSTWSACGLILLAGALTAAEPPAPNGPLDDLPEAIRQPLLQADEHLRRQEWDKARGVLQGLLAGGAEDHSWEGSYKAALWRLAVAEAGLGLAEDAHWHWQAIQAFGSPPPPGDLAPFGAAAEQLARVPLREPGTAPAELQVDRAPGLIAPRRIQGEALDLQRLLLEAHRWGFPGKQPGVDSQPARDPHDSEKVLPPKARRRPEPEIPRVASKPGTKGTVVIVSIIEKSGVIGEPFVIREDLGTEPNFAASGLDSICRWRFAPATYKGEPVRVYYRLTVSFRVTG